MMTPEQMKQMVQEVRAYLGITWEDENLDVQLSRSISGSVARLEAIYGYPLHLFEEDGVERTDADHLAYDLLLSRCFYIREKALDDFEPNFVRELMCLRNYGKVRRLKEKKEGE